MNESSQQFAHRNFYFDQGKRSHLNASQNPPSNWRVRNVALGATPRGDSPPESK